MLQLYSDASNNHSAEFFVVLAGVSLYHRLRFNAATAHKQRGFLCVLGYCSNMMVQDGALRGGRICHHVSAN